MFGIRRGQRASALAAARPGLPWLARRDWAQGRADGESGVSLAVAWIGIVLWNAVAFTVAYLALQGRAARASPAVLVLVLPAAGIVLLAWVVRASLRRARFGRTFVRLDAVPVPLGRALEGAIEAPVPLLSSVHLTLGCVNRITTGSGRSRSSVEHIRWQDGHAVAPTDLSRGPRGTTVIPVRFEVPRDLRPTEDSAPADTIRWLLRAQADLPGIDFDEVYEIPVFETPESPSLEQWTAQNGARRAGELRPPVRPTVVITTTQRAGTAYEFPAGRNPRLATGVTLFAAAFACAAYYLVLARAPLPIRIAFGAAVALLAWTALRLWFMRSRLVVEDDRLTVESSTLGLRRRRSWPRGALRHVRTRIGMQSGHGGRGVAYHDIVVGDSSGRDRVVATGLRDHHEAEWIVAHLRHALRLEERPG